MAAQNLNKKEYFTTAKSAKFCIPNQEILAPLPPVAGAENSTIQFTLTKSRLLFKNLSAR
jgi:hypothetical protein